MCACVHFVKVVCGVFDRIASGRYIRKDVEEWLAAVVN